MSRSKPPLKISRSIDGIVSDTVVVECVGSSSSISSSNPSSYSPSPVCPLFLSPSHVHFQQSLFTKIFHHILNHLLAPSLEWNRHQFRRDLLKLRHNLPTFFKKVGYVSHRFFESALLATKVFF
ncbi:hypothetical protein GEMRC1_009705 [Eukaryota sp. GEM-RC1]